MAGVTPLNLPGQLDLTGADDAAFWRLFAGEVLTEFHQKNKFMPLHRVKTIANGKSSTFPVTGAATARRHLAGESVYGTDTGGQSDYLSSIRVTEREIFVDDPLIAGTFTASIDEMKNHWDHRSVFTTELAAILAETADQDILSTLVAAAKAVGNNGGPTAAEKQITIADATVGANIADFAFKAKQLFNENNIPKEGRCLALRPKQYGLLAQETGLINKDYTSGPGDYNRNEIMTVAGFTVVESNSFKTADESNASSFPDPGVRNDPHGAGGEGYNCDWSAVGALAFQHEAAGTVKMKELGVESEKSVERRGHLIIADYVMGHGVLRPECAAWMDSTTI